jgi:hypothetical protein
MNVKSTMTRLPHMTLTLFTHSLLNGSTSRISLTPIHSLEILPPKPHPLPPLPLPRAAPSAARNLPHQLTPLCSPPSALARQELVPEGRHVTSCCRSSRCRAPPRRCRGTGRARGRGRRVRCEAKLAPLRVWVSSVLVKVPGGRGGGRKGG